MIHSGHSIIRQERTDRRVGLHTQAVGPLFDHLTAQVLIEVLTILPRLTVLTGQDLKIA